MNYFAIYCERISFLQEYYLGRCVIILDLSYIVDWCMRLGARALDYFTVKINW